MHDFWRSHDILRLEHDGQKWLMKRLMSIIKNYIVNKSTLRVKKNKLFFIKYQSMDERWRHFRVANLDALLSEKIFILKKGSVIFTEQLYYDWNIKAKNLKLINYFANISACKNVRIEVFFNRRRAKFHNSALQTLDTCLFQFDLALIL